jgi:beta-lactamase class A
MIGGVDVDLDGVPGTVSVWFGRPGHPPRYERLAHEPHYAASVMKVPVLVALYRGGRLDTEVPVVNTFASVVDGDPYGLKPRHDNDPEVWALLGGTAQLGWLARRMIVRSSNLAANLILREIGIDAADAVWRGVGATGSAVRRAFGDIVADDAGITNTVTAGDAARLLATLVDEPAILEPLLAQERTEDLAAGLPPGTRVALKNGWVRGVRHAAGLVYPDDAPPFVLAVCTTTPLAVNDPDDDACRLVRHIAAAAWADRHLA